MTETLASVDFEVYLDRWNAARQAREAARRDPYGYLSYAGFHQLEAAPQRFHGIPGTWATGPDGPAVALADGEQLTIDGDPVKGSHSFGPVAEREFRRAAEVGEVVIELSRRGGQDLLRPIDPSFGRLVRDDYDHRPAYEPDTRWIIQADFVPFGDLRPTPVRATIGGIVHIHPAVGEVVFEVDGDEQRLVVLARDDQQAGAPGTGFATFTDATGGRTTDPAGRSIEVEFPAQAGPVTLDFNYARNFQRPYTRFAPCPLAPDGNHLTVAIEAGEKLPVFRG
jgi:uncharacterized protein (DUF1684 family)